MAAGMDGYFTIPYTHATPPSRARKHCIRKPTLSLRHETIGAGVISEPRRYREQSNAALQRPGDNCATGKLSMRVTLIPIRCKRLLDCAVAIKITTRVQL